MMGGHAKRTTIAQVVERTDIVSDQRGALVRDPTLVNAWGLAFSPLGTAWVSANGSGLSEVLNSRGNEVIPRVMIPAAEGSDGSAPTGQLFNPDMTVFGGDAFIFASEDGAVSGWQPSDGANAVKRIDNHSRDAIYKGLAIAKTLRGETRLFLADFHNNRIDTYDSKYEPVRRIGGFVDRAMPAGFAPFNIMAVRDVLLVSYALQDKDAEDDVKGPGNGFVDAFDTNGFFLGRIISRGVLNSPWGMAISPSDFGDASDRLLVGNFGDGTINVFEVDLSRAAMRRFARQDLARLDGTLGDADGNRLMIDGLWAIQFGLGVGGFAKNTLYFTAGPNDEMNGLFGRLELPPTDTKETSACVTDP
jgi:uncharacterized protein (TIGR03118 family)